MVVQVKIEFRTWEDFWRYCRQECSNFKTGCANECELRKRLGIPPFSRSYEGKETGLINHEIP